MYRLPRFFFFLCVLMFTQPATHGLAQDAKPDDPPPLKAAGLRLPDGGARQSTFSPDGRLLVTKSESSIIVWDATTGKIIGEPIKPNRESPTPEITADGKFLIEIPRLYFSNIKQPPELRWWELPGLKPVGVPLQFKGECRVAVGPAGLVLTTELLTDKSDFKASNSEICLRELATGKLVGKPWTVDARVTAVAFSPDGKHVFIGSYPPKGRGQPGIRRYDVSNGTPVGFWSLTNRPISIVVSSDGKSAATVSYSLSHEVQRWNVETGKALGPKILAPPSNIPISGSYQMVAIHKDARTVAVTTKDKLTVQVLDLETGKAISPDLKHSERVFRLFLSPDGKRVLTASAGTDRKTDWLLWDVTSGRRIARVPDNQEAATIAFHPNGKALFAGGTLWELPAPK